MVANLTPASIRATAFGTYTLFNNLLGLAAGPLVVGALADRMGLDNALQIAPLVSVLAIIALLIGRTRLPQEHGQGQHHPGRLSRSLTSTHPLKGDPA